MSVSPIRIKPGVPFKALRVFTQLFAIVAILGSPLLGGWHRLEHDSLGAWQRDSELPIAIARALPSHTVGEKAYDKTILLGGGTGVRYFGIPMIDPVVGAASMTRTQHTPLVWLAFLLPLLIAMLFGRVFCGWFCPFGTVSRLLQALRSHIPFLPVPFVLGSRRPIRYFILIVAGVAAAMGMQNIANLMIPYLGLQQSIYSLWLEGGGGSVGGFMLGMLLAGFILGPTTVCASLCPTGAMLGLFGRLRRFRLRIEEPSECGPHCRLCDMRCWLSLDPSTGDAGPDCDGCMRCNDVCPHDNLRVGLGKGKYKALPVVASILLFSFAAQSQATEPVRDVRMRLVLDMERDLGDVDIAIGVTDLSNTRLDADAKRVEGGSEISLRLTRGPRPASDSRGKMGHKEHYKGALKVVVLRDGKTLEDFTLDGPNSPRSTVNRKVFRQRITEVLRAGDEIIITADNFLPSPQHFVIRANRAGQSEGVWLFFGAGFLLFAGLISLALAASKAEERVHVS